MDENDIETAAAAVACVLDSASANAGNPSPWQALGAWRVLARAGHPGKTVLLLEDESGIDRQIRVSGAAGHYRVELAGSDIQLYACSMEGGELFLEIAGTTRSYQVLVAPERIMLSGIGRYRVWRRASRWTRALAGVAGAAQAGTRIVASMPGTVTAVHAKLGDQVRAGEVLVLLEAMKIIQSLAAPVAGRVMALRCRPGATVNKGDILVDISTEDAA